MKLVAGAVLAALALIPARADASCGTPQWLGTPTGTKIPATGTLYYFASYQPEVSVHWPKNAEGIAAERKISDTVVALDYDAGHAREVTLGEDYVAATLAIDPKWRAPA